MKEIVTQDGIFHASEVMAVAILSEIFPKATVIRSNDPNTLSSSEDRIVVRPDENRYHRYNKSEQKLRKNGQPLTSVGLIWQNFGKVFIAKTIANQPLTVSKTISHIEQIWDIMDEKIITPIDVRDCTGCKAEITEITITDIISDFNPNWNEPKGRYYSRFMQAMLLATDVLENQIRLIDSRLITNPEQFSLPRILASITATDK